jgi:hypothetical protein
LVVEALVSDLDARLIDGIREAFSFGARVLIGFPHLFALTDSTVGGGEDLTASIRSVISSAAEKDIIG